MPLLFSALIMGPVGLICLGLLLRKLKRSGLRSDAIPLLLTIMLSAHICRIAYCEVCDQEGVEMAPAFARDDLVGWWSHGDATFELHGDGAFLAEGAKGAWSVEGNTLATPWGQWLVLRKHGALALIPKPTDPSDDGQWNYHSMYLQVR